MRGIGGMISFYVKGNEEDTLNFIKALKASFIQKFFFILNLKFLNFKKVIFTAVSLGGVESLIEHALVL